MYDSFYQMSSSPVSISYTSIILAIGSYDVTVDFRSLFKASLITKFGMLQKNLSTEIPQLKYWSTELNYGNTEIKSVLHFRTICLLVR